MPRLPALLVLTTAALLVPSSAPSQSPRVAIRTPSSDIAPRRGAVAARRTGDITIDGRLDDAAWREAAPTGDFVQRFPNEGVPATERTEVRVLYDDDALYVAAALHDSRPDSILAPLGRRDSDAPADAFFLQLDTYRDRRTAFVFKVTAAGVPTDLMITNGWMIDLTWDAVWQVATSRDSAGWYAEYRVPLNQLRFQVPSRSASRSASRGATGGASGAGAAESAPPVAFNANFLRWIARRGEDAQWSLIPQTSQEWVSHYGELRGMRFASAPRRLEVQPYTVARATSTPADGGNPYVGRRRWAGDVGADVRMGVGAGMTLTAAVNPDFGQVEADPSVVNLTGYELFFPERRPFFVEGADIFRQSGADWFDRTALFYSRRVGRAPQGAIPDDALYDDVPSSSRLLGAAKLSGKTAGGWSVGVLDAVTGEATARWMAGDGAAHRTVVEPMTNYAVARLARDMRGGATTVGLIGTAMHRRIGDEAALAELRASALTAGVDARHRVGEYEIAGTAVASRVAGSEDAIALTQTGAVHRFQRPDADHLDYDPTRTSLAGWAASARVVKIAGNLKWQLAGRAYSPGFEANDAGFLPQADVVTQFAALGYDGTSPTRYSRYWWLWLNQFTQWSFGGERLQTRAFASWGVELPSFWMVNGSFGRDLSALSVGALRGGPALRVPARSTLFARIMSDRRRALGASVIVDANREDDGGSSLVSVMPGIVARPSPRLQLTLESRLSRMTNDWQYVAEGVSEAGDAGAGARDTAWVLGRLRQTTASAVVRADYAFTPALTLQLYAQPFLSAGDYGRLREAADTRAPRYSDRFRALGDGARWDAAREEWLVDHDGDGATDYAFERPDFNRRDLIANAVLRWEWRPGSTLFVVWNHGRAESDDGGDFSLGRDAGRLWRAAASNSLIVKASYWFAP